MTSAKVPVNISTGLYCWVPF